MSDKIRHVETENAYKIIDEYRKYPKDMIDLETENAKCLLSDLFDEGYSPLEIRVALAHIYPNVSISLEILREMQDESKSAEKESENSD